MCVVAGATSDGFFDARRYAHVVVIPDVHGDKDAFIKSLWLAHAQIDHPVIAYSTFENRFVEAITEGVGRHRMLTNRPDVAMVQLGDLIDRGPYGAECLMIAGVISDVLGWEVAQLYGNHEIMGFLNKGEQYAHPRDFGGILGRRATLGFGSELAESMKDYFLGMAVLADASPDSSVNTLFVHGGVDLDWLGGVSGDSGFVEVINDRIETLTKTREGLAHINLMDSILWTRDLANEPDDVVCGLMVDQILTHFDVARIVLGHTPQDGLVRSRCDGKIILADVKMSRWMTSADVDESRPSGGNPVALVFRLDGGDLTTIDAVYGEVGSDAFMEENLHTTPVEERPPGIPFSMLLDAANAQHTPDVPPGMRLLMEAAFAHEAMQV